MNKIKKKMKQASIPFITAPSPIPSMQPATPAENEEQFAQLQTHICSTTSTTA